MKDSTVVPTILTFSPATSDGRKYLPTLPEAIGVTGSSRRTALRLGGATLTSLCLSGCLGGSVSPFDGGPDIEWRRTYDDHHRDDGRSLARTDDGGFVVAGGANTFGTDDTAKSYDAWVVRTRPDGTERWSETYGGTDAEEGAGVVPASDGDGFVVGGWSSSGTITSDFWLARIDDDGGVSWTQTYDNGGNEYLQSLAATHDGGYALAGSTGAPENGAGWLVRTSAMGEVEWSRTYAEPEHGGGLVGVVPTDDGGFLLAGHAGTSSETGYSWFRRIDGEGNVEWRAQYRKDGKNAGVNDVAVTSDGGLVAAGTTGSMGMWPDPDWVLKLDADGNRAWKHEQRKFYDPQVVPTPDGGAVVAGRRNGDLVMKRLDESGEKRWGRDYPKAKLYISDGLVRTDEGYVVLGRRHAGSLGDYGLTDAVLVKLR